MIKTEDEEVAAKIAVVRSEDHAEKLREVRASKSKSQSLARLQNNETRKFERELGNSVATKGNYA
jgi:hypothetical protein